MSLQILYGSDVKLRGLTGATLGQQLLSHNVFTVLSCSILYRDWQMTTVSGLGRNFLRATSSLPTGAPHTVSTVHGRDSPVR